MKHEATSLLALGVLLAGLAQAGAPVLEPPHPAPTLLAKKTPPPRHARPALSPARKAEITRGLYWLAMLLR
jgi:hypothetical protein